MMIRGEINTARPTMIENMTPESYHSDPCIVPSLSSSMASMLITATPSHVWHDSPRLNPKFVSSSSEAADRGIIMHDLVLLGQERAELLDFKDWRTSEAKKAREEAKAAGKIPLLRHQWPEYQAMRDALFRQMKDHHEHKDALQGGVFEASLFWERDGIAKRCRFDNVDFVSGWITDYKTTNTSISQWIKGQLFGEAKDIQTPHYSDGYEALTGANPRGFRYLVQEVNPPYCAAVVILDSHSHELALRRHAWAERIWSECLRTNIWPGYPARTLWASVPPWIETDFETKVLNADAADEDQRHLREQPIGEDYAV